MEIRSTIVALGIAAVAVTGAVALEWVAPADAVAQARGPRPLFREGLLPAARVNAITIHRGDDILEFRRSGTGWMQVQPFAYPMDPYSMEQLARLAEQLQTVQSFEPDPDDDFGPSALGLDPPDGQMRLQWPGGEVQLQLGRRGVGGRAYLQVAGLDTIYVVNHDLHDRALDMDPREWRSRRLFPDAGIDSTRIDYATGSGDERSVVTLVRRDGAWRMTAPVPSRVDEDALQGLVGAIGRAAASGFVLDNPDGLDRFGLEPPAGTFSVITPRRRETPGGVTERYDETLTLDVGARIGVGSEDRFGLLEGRPVVVRLPAAAIGALFPDPSRLISPLACGVALADVKQVQVRDSEHSFVIERNLDEWTLVADKDADPVRLVAERVNALLSALTAVRATSLRIDRFPREQPHVVVTLFGFDRRPLDTVRIVPQGEQGWIMENGDGVLRSYPASMDVPLTLEALIGDGA